MSTRRNLIIAFALVRAVHLQGGRSLPWGSPT